MNLVSILHVNTMSDTLKEKKSRCLPTYLLCEPDVR